MTLAAIACFITDVLAMGLPTAQGLILTENFYWDFNDRTRAFTKRVKPRLASGVFPNMDQAGSYAALVHYLKVVKALGAAHAKESGRATVAAMKRMPTDDDCFGPGSIREDGRKIHPAYLFRVKSPSESRVRGRRVHASRDHAGGRGVPADGGGWLSADPRVSQTPAPRPSPQGGRGHARRKRVLSDSRRGTMPCGLVSTTMMMSTP